MQLEVLQVSWHQTLKFPMSTCPNAERIQSSELLFHLFLLVVVFRVFRKALASKLQILDERTIWGEDIPGRHVFT